MACNRPITAYRAPDGAITFLEGRDSGPQVKLPCGRCMGCRLARSRDWAVRCMHEASLHDASCFLTLTYDDQHNPKTLIYEDFQRFMKRLRRTKGKCRYFAAGEYGTQTQRPHFHALIFGQHFTDLQRLGESLYRSPELEKLWKFGFSSVGQITMQSAQYVASYCTKKITGPMAKSHYTRLTLDGELIELEPEMAHMSKGIGKKWLEKNWRDVYVARDGIIQPGGIRLPPPRYYDKLMDTKDLKLMMNIETERAKRQRTENLDAREKNVTAKLKLKTRKL